MTIITWSKVVLLLLQLANKIFGSLQQQKHMDAGYDKRIAEEAAVILKNSKYAKQVMERINSMSPDNVDKLLQSLEPK